MNRVTPRPLRRAALVALAASALAAPLAAQPPRDRLLTLADGTRLHVREAGRGPAVVLLTGWTVPIDIWAPQFATLAARHRVLAIEPRGQGRSTHDTDALTPERRADDLAEVLRRLDVRRAVFVGWSLGAVELLRYFERHGTARVAGAVLVDQLATPDTTTAMKAAVHDAAVRLLRDRAGETRRFAPGMFAVPPAPARLEALVAGMQRTPSRNAIALMFGEVSTDAASALPRLTRPTVVLVPATTRSRAAFEAMVAALPDARLEFVERAGHALAHDRPDRLAAVVDSLVRRDTRDTTRPADRP